MAFKDYLTAEGERLLAKSIAESAPITFTKMVMGSGYLAQGTNEKNVTEVVTPVLELPIKSVMLSGSSSTVVSSYFSNTELDAGFYFREKALYMQVGTEEVVGIYGNAGSGAEYIDTAEICIIEKLIRTALQLTTDEIANVTLTDGTSAAAPVIKDGMSLEEFVNTDEALTISAGQMLVLSGTVYHFTGGDQQDIGNYTSGTKLSDVYDSKIPGADASGGIAASQNALYEAFNEVNNGLNKEIANRQDAVAAVNNSLNKNLGGIDLGTIDPSINCRGYVNDGNGSLQYHFEQNTDGVFTTQTLYLHATKSRIATRTFPTAQGSSGYNFIWIDNSADYALKSDLSKYLPLSGGSLTGHIESCHIVPIAKDVYALGSVEKPYANMRSNSFYSIKGGKSYGYLAAAIEGTATTEGISRLVVGNELPAGTAGNAFGDIIVYGHGTNNIRILPPDTLTTDNYLYLPSQNGILALTTSTVAAANKLLATGDSALNHKHLYLGAGAASSFIRSRNSASEIGFNLNIDGTNFEGLLMQGLSANSMQMFAGADNTCNLGLGSYRWKAVYAGSGVITTSDRTKKTDIVDLDAEHAKSFVMGLKPSTYKFVDGTSDRTHYGLVAQDIEELMETLDMDSKDFAGFIKSPRQELVEVEGENGEKTSELRDVEGEYDYSLRYDEFISPIIAVVQDHETRLVKLKNENEQLRAEISTMKSAFEALKAEVAALKAV